MNPFKASLVLALVTYACAPVSSPVSSAADSSASDDSSSRSASDASSTHDATATNDTSIRLSGDTGASNPPTELPPCYFEHGSSRTATRHVLLSMRSRTDGVLVARFWRCPVRAGTGESAIYRADRFELSFNGNTLRAGNIEISNYQNSHHNWFDSARITVDGYTIDWRVEYTGADEPPSYLGYFIRVRRGTTEVMPETRFNGQESQL